MHRHDPEAQSLGKIIMAAIVELDKMKADGARAEDLETGFERLVRNVWPKGREKPWQYLCAGCRDTGLEIHVCRPGMRCDGISTRKEGRRLCTQPSADAAGYEHDYGLPCVCSLGARFRPGQRSQAEADFTTATKSKPRTPTRFGR